MMNDFLVHLAQTIQCVSVRKALIISKVKNFDLWVADVKLAYFQSDEPVTRKIFITNPVPKSELSADEC